MQNDIIYGVEMIEFGVPQTDGTLPTSWTRFENIEEGSVSLTSNQDQKTNIIPEDKDVPIIVLYNPGDPDVFNFALLEISHENLAQLFNVVYDASTSSVQILAERKHANLAIRLTSRVQLGAKKRIIIPNAVCECSWKNAVSKTTLLTISVAASALAWKNADNKDVVYIIQKLNANGEPINSAAAFDTTLDFTTNASVTAESVTGTIAEADSHVKFKFNLVTSPDGTPENMVLKIAGVDVASIDFPSDYDGDTFNFIAHDDTVYVGTFANGNVTLTA